MPWSEGERRGPGVRRSWEDAQPILAHRDDLPSARRRLVQRAVQAADMAVTVVGVLPLGIIVVDQHAKTLARPLGDVLQHLQIPVGVAESRDWAKADVPGDADRLARAIVYEV